MDTKLDLKHLRELYDKPPPYEGFIRIIPAELYNAFPQLLTMAQDLAGSDSLVDEARNQNDDLSEKLAEALAMLKRVVAGNYFRKELDDLIEKLEG